MSGLTLSEWQTWLMQAIVGDSDAPPSPAMREGLGIYQEAYRARLREVLEDDYPVLRGYLGEQAFLTLAMAYVEQFPATHWSVRWYGRHMGEWLAADPRWQNDCRVSDIARIEWALGEAFDAADSPLTTVADLARHPPFEWPNLTFELHPSVRLVSLRSDTLARWKQLDEVSRIADLATAAPVSGLIWRRELNVKYRTLTDTEYSLLDAVSAGLSVADLCVILAGELEFDDVPGVLVRHLNEWATTGILGPIGWVEN